MNRAPFNYCVGKSVIINQGAMRFWFANLIVYSSALTVAGRVVLGGHAYAGAVIAATRSEKVKALVYVAALAPDEGETVADVFYRTKPHPLVPKLAPDNHALIYLPDESFAAEERSSEYTPICFAS